MSNADRIEFVAGLARRHAGILLEPKIKDISRRQERRQKAAEDLDQAIETLSSLALSAEALAASIMDTLESAQEDENAPDEAAVALLSSGPAAS